jgi:hypothetical protein
LATIQRSPHHLVDVNATPSQLPLARHHPGDIEEVVDESCLPLRVRVNGIDRSIATLVVEHMIFQHVRPTDQRVEWRAQLVRHHRQELILLATGMFSIAAGRVFPRQRQKTVEFLLDCSGQFESVKR